MRTAPLVTFSIAMIWLKKINNQPFEKAKEDLKLWASVPISLAGWIISIKMVIMSRMLDDLLFTRYKKTNTYKSMSVSYVMAKVWKAYL